MFTIYTRVQKLGGFNAIADNRVWKNLFEDLSEPGKCITQGMTKRRYERILLPFELYEREKRENGKHLRSELTISTIPKSSIQKDLHRVHGKQRHTASPAIEIIPLKNGVVKNTEVSIEQSEYNSSNDGVSLPVHVIVRLLPNECLEPKRNIIDSDKSVSSGQKENIPLMLQRSTTILPLARDGNPTKIVDLVDSDDGDSRVNSSDHLNLKKRKLDILREGGLEVTPISRKFHKEQAPASFPALSRNPSLQPNVSLMSLARAPPVIQSLNMYQSTSQVFKNPKEEVINVSKNLKSYCLDLTSKNQQQVFYSAQNDPRPNFKAAESNRRSKTNLMSIEEVQRNYRGSNPDLQITLVKPQIESPSSSSSRNANIKKVRQPASFKSKPKNVTSTSSSPQPQLPTLNPMLVAAASELQLQNMPSFFPFLSGLDITPQQSTSKSGANFDQSQATLMSYLSALYANPLLQGQNMLPNMAPAVEFLKLYNSASSNSRIPSSKN